MFSEKKLRTENKNEPTHGRTDAHSRASYNIHESHKLSNFHHFEDLYFISFKRSDR